MTDADRWAPTVAFYRATLAAIVLVGAALLFRRPDLLVLATPLAVVTVWSSLTRPTRPPTIVERLSSSIVREGESTTWQVEVSGADEVELVTAIAANDVWLEHGPAHGAITSATHDGAASLAIGLRSTRWGHRMLDSLNVSATSSWAGFWYERRLPSRFITALPLPAVFDSQAAVHPTDGLVGSHRSIRAGEGTEFASIRAFQTGDRIRRINWSRSLRSNRLQVNSTWADQDTHVALVIDINDDLGASGGIDGVASSLDMTVRAAGAIASHFVHRGDRVSLSCLHGSSSVSAPPATGPAHLRRILNTLARVKPTGSSGSDMTWRGSAATADLTVILSPLATSHALDRAVMLGRLGRSVVAVDTLPDQLAHDDDPATALAWRIRLLERRRELRAVSEFGVGVVRWLGPGSLDQFLRQLARHASAPRVRT